MAIVEFQRAVQWQLILDVEINLEGAGLRAGTQLGDHAAVGLLVERQDLAAHVVHVGHGPHGHRGGRGANRRWREIPCAAHPQPGNRAFHDFQPDHACGGVLLRNQHRDGLKARIAVSPLKGHSCPLDVSGRAVRAEMGIDRLLDLQRIELRRTRDTILADIECESEIILLRGSCRTWQRRATKQEHCGGEGNAEAVGY